MASLGESLFLAMVATSENLSGEQWSDLDPDTRARFARAANYFLKDQGHPPPEDTAYRVAPMKRDDRSVHDEHSTSTPPEVEEAVGREELAGRLERHAADDEQTANTQATWRKIDPRSHETERAYRKRAADLRQAAQALRSIPNPEPDKALVGAIAPMLAELLRETAGFGDEQRGEIIAQALLQRLQPQQGGDAPQAEGGA